MDLLKPCTTELRTLYYNSQNWPSRVWSHKKEIFLQYDNFRFHNLQAIQTAVAKYVANGDEVNTGDNRLQKDYFHTYFIKIPLFKVMEVTVLVFSFNFYMFR